jgi:hypothetical protein
VVVDFRTAYQHEEDWCPQSYYDYLVWFKNEPRQSIEIPKRICGHAGCHLTSCLVDAYHSRQRARCDKVIREINGLLDDYRLGSTDSGAELGRFKKDMEHQELISLLPGVAYAYVLRTRKWGKPERSVSTYQVANRTQSRRT